MQNKTFDERLEYGKSLEYVAIARFLSYGIESDEIPCESPTDNMIKGDLYIMKPVSNEYVRIDAKRTCNVSLTSVERFTGSYYLFSPSGSLQCDDWWMVKADVVKSYCSKIDKPKRFPNGNQYYTIPVNDLRLKVSFLDFIANDCCA